MGYTTMNFSVHNYNAGDLVSIKTLQPQFTTRSKTKTICFCWEIVNCGINLLKIDTFSYLEYLFTKVPPRTTFEYLHKKIMGW